MAKYRNVVKIDYDTFNNYIYTYSNYSAENNVSRASLLGTIGRGRKGMYLNGQTKMNGKSLLFDETAKYPGYNSLLKSSAVPTAGVYLFPSDVEMRVNRSAFVYDYYIIFDIENNEYATSLQIGSTVYSNSSPIFKRTGVSTLYSTILLKSWNKPNSVAKISSIKYSYIREYTDTQIKDLTITEQDRTDSSATDYGLCSQSGSVVLFNSPEFRALNKLNLLKQDITVNIYLENIDTLARTKIATMKTESWEYAEDQPYVTVKMTDSSKRLEQFKYPGLGIAARNLKQCIDDILTAAGVSFYYTNENGVDTATICGTITIPNSFLLPSNGWEALNKCCQVGGLRIAQDRDGIIYIKAIR